MTLLAAAGLQLGECLGKGAYGSVYSGLVVDTGEVLAVKQLALANLVTSEITHIMGEIDLLKELKHPNIVKYRGFFQTRDHLNILMEFCENGSLSSICRKFGKFPERLVALYIRQVLEGLAYLHEQGVIHRDIKAANILTTKKGEVKLADFGIASKIDSSIPTLAGSPYWMAPEIIELHGATVASDIWSLGCTIIELLQGNPPYYDFAPVSALFHIVHDDHPPLPDVVSPLLRDFLLECFQKDDNLRITARRLLKHPWIQMVTKANSGNEKGPKTPLPPHASPKTVVGSLQVRQPRPLSLQESSKDVEADVINDVWDSDFEPFDAKLGTEPMGRHFSPSDNLSSWLSAPIAPEASPNTDDDPFAALLDTTETFQDPCTAATQGLQNFVNALQAGCDVSELLQLCAAACSHIADHPTICRLLVTHHAIGTILTRISIDNSQELQVQLLRLLNLAGSFDVTIQEITCLLGGLKHILKFSECSYAVALRKEAALFTFSACAAKTGSLQMVLACEGANALVQFVGGRYERDKEIIILAVRAIGSALDKQNSLPKADFCHLLAGHGIIQYLYRRMNDLLQDSTPGTDHCLEMLCDLFVTFSRGDARLKEALVQEKSMRVILSSLPHFKANLALKILIAIKNLTMHPETLRMLEAASVIKPLCALLSTKYGPFHTEMQNQILSAVFNLCRLSKTRLLEAADGNLIPYLQLLIQTKNPLKQFAVPILADMVNAGSACRTCLWDAGAADNFMALLSDSAWQVDALEAISSWTNFECERLQPFLEHPHALQKLLFVFCNSEPGKFEKILVPFHKVLTASQQLCVSLANIPMFVHRIFVQMSHADTVVRLNLLHIVHQILSHGGLKGSAWEENSMLKLTQISKCDSAVLVREQAKRCLVLITAGS
ncbi:kinase-like domain-containing protein [Phlyctochytrium arcticum]|nr:kinase-like domain-containing protein [Phlyctochytrium arcticum]